MKSSPISPTNTELKRARDEFANLLSIRTKESVWQKFFSENPYVLSQSLPLKLLPSDIVPMGRPGKSEPDFIIYPGSSQSLNLHGIVELKTPHSRIIRQPRRNILSLSSDAQTAIQQVLKYDELYDSFAPSNRTLSFQSASHLFVIIGRDHELLSIEQALRSDLRKIFPPGINFLSFDMLFDNFIRGIPESVVVLAPRISHIQDTELENIFGSEQDYNLILHRLVQSKNPPITIFSDKVTAQEVEALRQIESRTGYRTGKYRSTKDQHLYNPYIMAPFTHISSFSSRFRPAGAGAFYGADSPDAAIAELTYHTRNFFQSTSDSSAEFTAQHHVFRFRGRLATLSNGPSARLALDPNGYDYSAQVGRHAIERGLNGIVYPSIRGPGRIAVIYQPKGIEYLESRGFLSFSWNGSELTYRYGIPD